MYWRKVAGALASAPALQPKALATAAFAGGLLVGAATGLKLTAGLFEPALCLAFVATVGPWWRGLGLGVLAGIGVLIGVALAGGAWFWHAYDLTGNPFFPYLNNLFHSDLAVGESNRELSRLPRGLVAWLAQPVLIYLEPWLISLRFRDPRLAATYLATLVGLMLLLWQGLRRHRPPLLGPGIRFLLVFVAVAYVVWLVLFGVYRYAIVLEMLAPLLFTAVLFAFAAPSWRWPLAAGALLGLAVLTQQGDWQRRPFGRLGDAYVAVQGIDPGPLADAMVLMTAWRPGSKWRPASFLMPSFPAQVKFIRIAASDDPAENTYPGASRIARERIARHRGPFFVLFNPEDAETVGRQLAFFGLRQPEGRCDTLTSNVAEPFRLCPVAR
ncbi:MAG: hypothetical protein FJX68_09025 [Alphaproteobacteria bacterium]|nr:hypothetical protein [Alphaproteobacteria bacterium]